MKIRVRVFTDGVFQGYEVLSCEPKEFFRYQLELLRMEPTCPPSIATYPAADIYADYKVCAASPDALKVEISKRCTVGIPRVLATIQQSRQLRQSMFDCVSMLNDPKFDGSMGTCIKLLEGVEDEFHKKLIELEKMVEGSNENSGQ